MAVYDRGDIVMVRFDPVEGHEMRGANRPALVLTMFDRRLVASNIQPGSKRPARRSNDGPELRPGHHCVLYGLSAVRPESEARAAASRPS